MSSPRPISIIARSGSCRLKALVAALRSLGEEGARAAAPYMRWESEGSAEAAIEVLAPQSFARSLFVPELLRRVRQAWGDLLALQVTNSLFDGFDASEDQLVGGDGKGETA